MSNTIKLKYGSGIPGDDQLAVGEVGLDLFNKVIYTADIGGNIIEMGRNMGEGGTIGWDQIDPDTIPPSLEIIINGEIPEYITLDALVAQVKVNEDDIAALKAWETTAKTEISQLQSDVTANTAAIEANATAISTNATNIGKNSTAISGAISRLDIVEPKVEKNTLDIAALEASLNQDLTGLILAGTYSAANNLITSVKETAVDADGDPLFVTGTTLKTYTGNNYASYYFIVDEAGKLENTGTPANPDLKADGDDAYIGDWMVSDGPHWLHFNFSQESTAWGTIGGVLSAQTDLQDALDEKYDESSTIVCGTYSS
jgi:hypothetical protein